MIPGRSSNCQHGLGQFPSTDDNSSTGLSYGAPALAFALVGAAAVHPGAYQGEPPLATVMHSYAHDLRKSGPWLAKIP
jgi:hypothetical protein